MKQQRLALLCASGLALGLAACQHLDQFGQQVVAYLGGRQTVKITAVAANDTQRSADSGETALYERAVTAIDQRDYGLALDVLQLAREAKENDPRVLTAMGVVYDKLGRFDLSKRYYDLAEAADPGSKVVATDRAYSLVLQQRINGERAPQVVVLADTPPVIRLASAAAEAVVLTSAAPPRVSILGGVMVRNATGRPGAAAPIRADLARKGWTVYRTTERHAVTAITLVQVPTNADRESAAIGLARTLTFPVKLVACANCRMLKLTLGIDSLHNAKVDPSPRVRRA